MNKLIARSHYAAILIFSLLAACCATPQSPTYNQMYVHPKKCTLTNQIDPRSDYFLVVLVDACHLNYDDNFSFLRTVAKHPANGSKNGDFGHAWIYLQGILDGQVVYLEGGQSGEQGLRQAKYFDGIMNYIDYGYANPSRDECLNPVYEPNPSRYLWETLHDGFFQWGSGSHRPSFAVSVELSPEQFNCILAFVENYNYAEYSLIGSQCSSFVAQVALLAGLDLKCEITIPIDPQISLGGRSLRLWTNPCYAELTFASPDVLEYSLMQAVGEGKAQCALQWYLRTHPVSSTLRIRQIIETIIRFPERYSKLRSLQNRQ